MLYTGRAQSLGIKSGGAGKGEWAELPVSKSPKIVQYAIGHEAQHAILLTDDANVFFVGTAKKGEDGDSQIGQCLAATDCVEADRLLAACMLGVHMCT